MPSAINHAVSFLWVTAVCLLVFGRHASADDFDQFVKPLLIETCIKCHGEKQVKGKVNLKEITSFNQFRGKPELIQQVFEAIDSDFMPPDDEPQFERPVRAKLLATLRVMLESSTANSPTKLPPRRLNRFQYNNAIRDLFDLKVDVFPLPEKLMTRHENYLHSAKGVMPDIVQVSSDYLLRTGGLSNVTPYPKDLRASHGFDNQANQLTLSPLLLEAYIRLSLSIVESPDFNPENVGIWPSFFAEPAVKNDLKTEVRRRLAPFMQKAFRTDVEPAVLDRYTSYITTKLEQGLPFPDAMKKGVAAILCSPLFLYRYDSPAGDKKSFELASRLSFFLWGAAPDDQLLALASSGELSKPDVLKSTIDRMLVDPKIEGFLDSFPSQWLQLENLFGVTPDPQLYPQYSLPGGVPASVQMVLEPLLLFDAVFVENRPVIELIKPNFTYQSDFLKTWYQGELSPSKALYDEVARELRIREETRTALYEELADLKSKQAVLAALIRERLLRDKRQLSETTPKEQLALKPYAVWDFEGDLTDSVSSRDLTAHGKIFYEKGGVVLNGAYLESKKLPIDLKAKTLEVWCSLRELNERGGGVMTIQDSQSFDSIVFGERRPKQWISGSENHVRTQDFSGASEEEKIDELLHLVMVYQGDGTIALYRNGSPYGESYQKEAVTFSKDETAVLFGLRHLPAGGNRYLSVRIDKARLYDYALSAEEVVIAGEGKFFGVTDREITAAMSPEEKAKSLGFIKAREEAEAALKKLPPKIGNLEAEVQARFNQSLIEKARSRVFRRVPAEDPRYGGIITNAATLTMTSAPKRTLPIARGAWMIEVIFNDPPPPPPNDVPPLNEDGGDEHLTIREKFAKHRENPDCAGCHARIDPLGFSLENFDITGRWRTKYDNNRDVDAGGTLFKKHAFADIVDLKEALVKEEERFAKAFTAHLLRYALARELTPADALTVDKIVATAEPDGFRLKSLIREVILSDSFRHQN